MIDSRLSRLNERMDKNLFSFFQGPAKYLNTKYGMNKTKVSKLWTVSGEAAALMYLGAYVYDYLIISGNLAKMVLPVLLTAGYSIAFFRNGMKRASFIEEQSSLFEQHLIDEGLPYETDLQRQNYAKAALWYPISMVLSAVSIMYQVTEQFENPLALVQAIAFIGAINGIYGCRYTLFVDQHEVQ